MIIMNPLKECHIIITTPIEQGTETLRIYNKLGLPRPLDSGLRPILMLVVRSHIDK
jgi:hypothetical protein